MRPRLQRPLLTACLILALASAARGDDPSPNPVEIWIDVNFDQPVNAGFGELTPGPHDLKVTFQMGVADVSSAGVLYGGLWDQSGYTMYAYGQSAPGSSSLSLNIIGVSEDTLGCVVGGGYHCNWDTTVMRGFNLTIANATFPPAPSTCDPMGMMGGMMGGMPGACESLEEGEVSISPGGEATVYVTVKHQAPGTLTVTSANSDIQVVSGASTPVSGEQSIPITLRAADTFQGEQRITCRFVHDSGGRDTQDVLKVKSGPPPVLIARIIDTDSDPEGAEDDDTPPLQKYVGNGVTLQAIPDPADGMFAFAPSWKFTAVPNGSSFQFLAMSGQPFISGETCSFTPDVEGTYSLTATSGNSSKPIDIDAHPVGILKIVDTDADPEGDQPDDTPPLQKIVGMPVELNIVPDPETASFPPNQPTWTVTFNDPESGPLQVAQGFGTSVAFLPATEGDYIVQAQNGMQKKEVPVVVMGTYQPRKTPKPIEWTGDWPKDWAKVSRGQRICLNLDFTDEDEILLEGSANPNADGLFRLSPIPGQGRQGKYTVEITLQNATLDGKGSRHFVPQIGYSKKAHPAIRGGFVRSVVTRDSRSAFPRFLAL